MTEEDKDCLFRAATEITKFGARDFAELIGHLLVKQKPLVVDEIPLIDGLPPLAQHLARNEIAHILEREGLAQRRNGKTVRLYATAKALRIGKSMMGRLL